MDINTQQEVAVMLDDSITKPTQQGVLLMACQQYGITFQDIKGRNRSANLINARCLAIASIKYLYPNTSLKEMGRILNLHHTTVIYHHNRHKDLLKYEIESDYVGKYFDVTDRLERWIK